jgi:hypothetical protein
MEESSIADSTQERRMVRRDRRASSGTGAAVVIADMGFQGSGYGDRLAD